MDTQLSIDTNYYDRWNSSTLCDWERTGDDSPFSSNPQPLLSDGQIEDSLQAGTTTITSSYNNDAIDYMATAQYAFHATQASVYASSAPEVNLGWQLDQVLLRSPCIESLQEADAGKTAFPTGRRSLDVTFQESGDCPEIMVDVTTEVR
jgi:hypothetical protein